MAAAGPVTYPVRAARLLYEFRSFAYGRGVLGAGGYATDLHHRPEPQCQERSGVLGLAAGLRSEADAATSLD